MYFHIIEDKEAIHITRLTLTITQTHRKMYLHISAILRIPIIIIITTLNTLYAQRQQLSLS